MTAFKMFDYTLQHDLFYNLSNNMLKIKITHYIPKMIFNISFSLNVCIKV